MPLSQNFDQGGFTMLKKILPIFLMAFFASKGFSYENFRDYCRDCKKGSKFGYCTPEIRHTVETMLDLVGGDNCLEQEDKLSKMGSISLNKKQILDLSPLARFHRLKILSLQENQVSDLKPLSLLTNLTWLHLGQNKITDVSPLEDLKNLDYLYIGNNQVTEFDAVEGVIDLIGRYNQFR